MHRKCYYGNFKGKKPIRKSSSEKRLAFNDVIQLGGNCAKLEDITVVITKIKVLCNMIQTFRRPCCIHLQGLCIA